MPGCKNLGIVTEVTDLAKTYCIDHAWKDSRPDEAGLQHPLQVRWNAEDALRAHGAGLAVSDKDLPEVSEGIAEQCKRELEEGRKKGWKTR